MGGAVRTRTVLAAVAFALTVGVGPVQAQAPPQVRLAAPADCLQNPGCGAGLQRAYGIDVAAAFTPLTSADAGVSALDDGVGEVAVAFSSDPQLSRPDIRSLADDRRMIGADHVVPVVRRGALRRIGARRTAELRRRLNAASRLVTTLALRQMNQQIADGRLAEPVGGEFVSANGLGGSGRRGAGATIRIGYQEFTENAVLAHLYAEALRAAGFRVTVRTVRGLREESLRALRNGTVDLVAEYAGSLRRALGSASLADRGLRAFAQAPGENRNVFVMRRDVAVSLGVAKISDLRRYWPASG